MKDEKYKWESAEVTESKSYSEIRREILEKLAKRTEFRQCIPSNESFCEELNPDVIVISDDQSFLFEPQNQRALEVLTVRCGLALGVFKMTERIRVHPLTSRKIIDDLTRAGLHVAQECSS
jgi:hypothetical protein